MQFILLGNASVGRMIISKKNGAVLTDDQTRIAFDHYSNGHSSVIVLAHGFYNSKKAVLFQEMAENLLDVYDVVVMDYRGHGESEGRFTWSAKEPLDLTAILAFARERYARVGVIGFSMGAAVGLIVAAQANPMDSLIAVSPPSEFGKIDFHFWKMDIMENVVYNVLQEGRIGKGFKAGAFWLKKTKPIEIVAKIKIPTLFYHGAKDWLVLPWHSKQLYQKAGAFKRIEIIANGTHAEYLFRRDREGTINRFKNWFRETLSQAGKEKRAQTC